MENSAALSVRHMTVSYDAKTVLWDVNFTVPKGKMVGVFGPNGAGKSTLLKAMMQMIKPLSGQVHFFGKSLSEARGLISYVPQRSSVDWDFPITALEVVLMGQWAKKGLFGFSTKEQKHLAYQALDKVGLACYCHRKISALSGGQQQRVFIARALVQEAQLYIMDEPFAGVDMTTEDAIIDILRLLKKQGKTLLIVHHDLSSANQYFDMGILLNTSLIAHGEIPDVLNQKNLTLAYGSKGAMLGEAIGIAQRKNAGL